MNKNIDNEYEILEFGNIHELEANIVKLKTQLSEITNELNKTGTELKSYKIRNHILNQKRKSLELSNRIVTTTSKLVNGRYVTSTKLN